MASSENADGRAPAKPSRLRQLLPWLFAAAILAYMFHAVEFGKVRHEWLRLGSAQFACIVAAYLVYCAVYYLTDVLSFYRCYNWFNTAIGLAETARLRFASYTVQALNGAITELMSVLYMLRVKKVPALAGAGSAGFVYFNETYTMIAFLTYCAFFLPEANRITLMVPGLGVGFWRLFQALTLAAWAFLPLWLLFWRTGLCKFFPKVRNASALMAFRQARLGNYAEVFVYRFSNNLVSIGANIVILRVMGIEAPVALLFAVVPVMVNVAYWPVSAGGFGGPQLVADFLLKGYASEEKVLAYSLVWSALFFMTRTLTGIAFIRPAYRAAFPVEK